MYEAVDNHFKEARELDNTQALDQFLASVERRAFRMAFIATANPDDALDIVQDAMFKLASKYAKKSAEEWGPLFHRIVQSTVNDWHRKQKVRRRWQTVLSFTGMGQDDEQQTDPIENAPAREDTTPTEQIHNEQSMVGLDSALQQLPTRQQQAFMLRVWEGLSVKETAQAMGCTDGSVKTHYSRAIHVLREKLKGFQ